MRIEVLGTSFILQTDQDTEYLQDIIDYLETKIQEIRISVATQDSLKIAILSCIVVIDELFRERGAGPEEPDPEIEKITRDLIKTIEKALENSGTSEDSEPSRTRS